MELREPSIGWRFAVLVHWVRLHAGGSVQRLEESAMTEALIELAQITIGVFAAMCLMLAGACFFCWLMGWLE